MEAPPRADMVAGATHCGRHRRSRTQRWDAAQKLVPITYCIPHRPSFQNAKPLQSCASERCMACCGRIFKRHTALCLLPCAQLQVSGYPSNHNNQAAQHVQGHWPAALCTASILEQLGGQGSIQLMCWPAPKKWRPAHVGPCTPLASNSKPH